MRITEEKLIEFELFLKPFNKSNKLAFEHFVKQRQFAENETRKISKRCSKIRKKCDLGKTKINIMLMYFLRMEQYQREGKIQKKLRF